MLRLMHHVTVTAHHSHQQRSRRSVARFFLLLVSATSAIESPAEISERPIYEEACLKRCVEYTDCGGYPNGWWEQICAEFDIPHAFFIKCIRMVRQNPEALAGRSGCHEYFESLSIRGWGPWRDYSIDEKLRTILLRVYQIYHGDQPYGSWLRP